MFYFGNDKKAMHEHFSQLIKKVGRLVNLFQYNFFIISEIICLKIGCLIKDNLIFMSFNNDSNKNVLIYFGTLYSVDDSLIN